jgi:predicted dehydrogenase
MKSTRKANGAATAARKKTRAAEVASGRRDQGPRGGRVRFAVIGQGYFAQAAILPAFATTRRCELRAIFSEDETKLARLRTKYGVAAALGYDQYDEYLRSGEVDAVYIAVPNDQHRDYVVRAARAGIHVLCEKPLGLDSDEAERMKTVCEESKVKLMVAYRLHFEGATLEAIEQATSGLIGRPRFFSSTFAMQVEEGNIRTRAERGGGPLLDLGVYCVNAARSLFRAEPIEVTAISATRRGDPRFKEIDEQVSALLRFPDDRLAQLTCSFGAYDHSAVTVVGEKGRISLDPAYDYATDLTVRTEVEGKKPREKKFPKRDQVAGELDAFAACVREGRDPEPSGEEGLADLRVIDAIRRAVQTRRVEAVHGVERRVHPGARQAVARPPHDMPPLVHAEAPGKS